jgi:hypothetical protein
MSKQNIPVAVYMETQVLVGLLAFPDGQRLSDYLNDENISQTDTSVNFLQLSDVTIQYADGRKESAKTIHVNREAIQMIKTMASDSAKGNHANNSQKIYPFVKKLPVRATMRLPDYELVCNVHQADNETTTHLLAENRTFIACTDAKIREIHQDTQSDAGFVLINRRQMYSLYQAE